MKLDPQRTERNFKKLLRIAPELRQTKEYAKSKVCGLMDLNLDVLERSQGYMRIALSHYWIHHSNDMIPDPDMEIAIFLDDGLAEALSYQDAFTYEIAYSDGATLPVFEVHTRLNEFLEQWLDNLAVQGHVLIRIR
jgi:uncharacterized protein YqiB (DUF1249 family)